MIAKLSIVEEEGEETLYWPELLIEAGLMPESRLAGLMEETDEIVAMTVASIKTLRTRQRKPGTTRGAPTFQKRINPCKLQIQNPKSKIQNRISCVRVGANRLTGRRSG